MRVPIADGFVRVERLIAINEGSDAGQSPAFAEATAWRDRKLRTHDPNVDTAKV